MARLAIELRSLAEHLYAAVAVVEVGVLQRLLEALAEEHDDEGDLIDATIVRAHQDSSGRPKGEALKRLADLVGTLDEAARGG